jgi:hypothetical protein
MSDLGVVLITDDGLLILLLVGGRSSKGRRGETVKQLQYSTCIDINNNVAAARMGASERGLDVIVNMLEL